MVGEMIVGEMIVGEMMVGEIMVGEMTRHSDIHRLGKKESKTNKL